MISRTMIGLILALAPPDAPDAGTKATPAASAPSAERTRELKDTLARRKRRKVRALAWRVQVDAALQALLAAATAAGTPIDSVTACPACGGVAPTPPGVLPLSPGTVLRAGGRSISVQVQVC